MGILRANAFEPAVRFERPLIERMRRFPRERGAVQRGIQTIAACSIRAWLRLYHRFEIVGRENLPASGSFVMVANHASHLDALCLLSALPLARLDRAFPAAARDYFFDRLPRLALSVFVLNALPFDRTAHVRESLNRCRDLLSRPGNHPDPLPGGDALDRRSDRPLPPRHRHAAGGQHGAGRALSPVRHASGTAQRRLAPARVQSSAHDRPAAHVRRAQAGPAFRSGSV